MQAKTDLTDVPPRLRHNFASETCFFFLKYRLYSTIQNQWLLNNFRKPSCYVRFFPKLNSDALYTFKKNENMCYLCTAEPLAHLKCSRIQHKTLLNFLCNQLQHFCYVTLHFGLQLWIPFHAFQFVPYCYIDLKRVK